MREASWNDCITSNSATKTSTDKQRALSLAETAKERLAVAPKPDEKNCNFVFEDHYTSLLELLQALVISNGYNVKNHICLGYYLRDILKREDLYLTFDDLRTKRNQLTYYGNRMDYTTATSAIEKSKRFINMITKMLP